MAMQYGGFARTGGQGGPISRAVNGGRVGTTGLFDAILKNRPMISRGQTPNLGNNPLDAVRKLFGNSQMFGSPKPLRRW